MPCGRVVGMGGAGVAVLLLGNRHGGNEGGDSEDGAFLRVGVPAHPCRVPPCRVRRFEGQAFPFRIECLALNLSLCTR